MTRVPKTRPGISRATRSIASKRGVAGGRKAAPVPVALVTGAGRGLGRAVTRALVGRKYCVVTCSTSSTAPGLGEALHRRVDVSDPAAVDAFMDETVARFGRLDVLVNNAGYANAPMPISGTSEEVARRCFGTNVLGPYSLMRRALPVMIAQPEGGVVINIASRAALAPVPGLAAYSASKTALVSLTLAAAKEVDETRVLCVSVCPGGMDTEMRAALYGAEDSSRQLNPDTVAALVVDLAATRALSGIPVRSGSAVLVSKDSGVTVLEWPENERGHRSLILR